MENLSCIIFCLSFLVKELLFKTTKLPKSHLQISKVQFSLQCLSLKCQLQTGHFHKNTENTMTHKTVLKFIPIYLFLTVFVMFVVSPPDWTGNGSDIPRGKHLMLLCQSQK